MHVLNRVHRQRRPGTAACEIAFAAELTESTDYRLCSKSSLNPAVLCRIVFNNSGKEAGYFHEIWRDFSRSRQGAHLQRTGSVHAQPSGTADTLARAQKKPSIFAELCSLGSLDKDTTARSISSRAICVRLQEEVDELFARTSCRFEASEAHSRGGQRVEPASKEDVLTL